MPLVVVDEAMEQFILDAEDADRLRVMNELYRGDVAGEINTDQKDQGGRLEKPFDWVTSQVENR